MKGVENDTGAMQAAATAWKEVAYGANVAISLAHHTRKLNGQEATIDDQRGSSALRDKCRQNRVLNPMPSTDAIEFGIPECERFGYFSTGPSEKTNMTARTGRKTWFRTIGVSVGLRKGNMDPGDSVGVVTAWEPPSLKLEMDPEPHYRAGADYGSKRFLASVAAGVRTSRLDRQRRCGSI